MKCENCGAEIGNNKFCQFCGTQVSVEMRREQEILNKKGCPKCGSSNVQFNRENQGEIRGKNNKKIVHKTVGFCKDCGFTWYPGNTAEAKKNNTLIWWVLGWIFFFPAPLMVLIWRKKNTWDIKIKIGITVAFWLIFIIVGLSGNKDKSTSLKTSSEVEKESTINTEDIATSDKENDVALGEEEKNSSQNKTLYDDAQIVDMKNGAGTAVIGTVSEIHADEADCTEEVLTDWYFNYVLKHSDCKYHVIAYNNSTKGVYANGMGFIQKSIELKKDENGLYYTGDDAGSTYYTVDEDNKSITAEWTMAASDVVEDVREKVEDTIPEEYKEGEAFSVDIAGVEGSDSGMDCNIILVNESFKDADYQGIATDMASKIKKLNLGIGYFSISFQTDDYKLYAISSLEDLDKQEASQITTQEFDN